MRKPHHQTRSLGITRPLAATIAASVLWLGCSPGSLPCEEEEWKAICARDAGPAVNRAGGAGGGSAGTGGSAGMPGGSGGTAAQK